MNSYAWKQNLNYYKQGEKEAERQRQVERQIKIEERW